MYEQRQKQEKPVNVNGDPQSKSLLKVMLDYKNNGFVFTVYKIFHYLGHRFA